ncbi:MAG: hypothetical protein ACYS6K_24715 [Planctomycetota bacterium]|jgi:predicted TIM-barrel fold metal-dependent hydrolase
MRTILQAFLEGDGFPNELVIDAHTHIGRGFDGSQYIEDAAQRALTRMDAVGIDASCVMGSQYLIEGDYKEGNNDLLWLHEHYPDRFVCFTNVNPHDKLENILAELKRMYDAGLGPVVFARITDDEKRQVLGLNMARLLCKRGYLPDNLQDIKEFFQ